MPRFLLRALVFALLYMTLAACSGGGCGGSAIPPIRGGYPLPPVAMQDRRIPHAIQVRLTDQGLRSVEAIGPSLLGSFLGSGIAVPTVSQNVTIGRAVICPSGRCRINVSIATTVSGGRGFELSLAPPESLRMRVRLVLQGDIPLQVCAGSCSDTCGGTFCATIARPTLSIDTRRGSRQYIGLETAVTLRRENRPNTNRHQYMRADLTAAPGQMDKVALIMGEDIEAADLSFSDSWISEILNLFRGTIIGQVRGQLASAVGPIEDALAASSMPDPPGCPTGTRADGNRCRYSDNSLVPMLLGTDGEGNFGSLLNSITPGIRAPNRFVIAAGDPAHGAEVSTTGATINVFGTFESLRQATCVPAMAPPPMPTVPEYMALRSNVIPGTMTTTDLGIGVSEEFLNNMFWNWWNSGMFCLGITSRISQQVSAGLLTALPQLASLRPVIFPASPPMTNAPMAIAFRPQQAPTVRVGGGTNLMTDPLLRLTFTNLALDFYVWSEERYVRIFTLTSNLSIPINLTPSAAGLQPALGAVGVENAVVTNVALITSQPTQLADLLRELLGTIVTQFAGSLPAVNLPSIPLPGGGGAMIDIQIPANGVRGVTEGSSRFLGLFANLRCSGGLCSRMNTVEIAPTVRAELMPFDADVLRFEGAYRSELTPRVRLQMGAQNTFGRDIEYRYRVDNGTWSEWTRDSTIEATAHAFALQGRHTIDVTARIVGDVFSESRTYASATVIIDATAPVLTVERNGTNLIATAHDAVSLDDAIEYQFNWTGHEGAWGRSNRATLPADAQNIRVRARDESGRIAEQAVNSMDALTIRGGPSTDSSGCGCTTPGRSSTDSRGNAILLALSAGLAATFFSRRKKSSHGAASNEVREGPVALSTSAKSANKIQLSSVVLRWGVVASFFIGLGCNCGDTPMPSRDAALEAGSDASMTCENGAQFCPSMRTCVPQPMCGACMPGFMAGGQPVFDAATCMWRTTGDGACTCTPLPPLNQGMAGSHLDMAVHTDNTVWLSGYSAGDPFTRKLYGDLIVGRWNMAMSRVDWQHVDGVPTGGNIGGAVDGWRGGVDTPGPDVGRWNSIQLNAMGHPRVTYWDTTNEKLKFASFDGTRWTTHVVDDTGRNGRYSSLVLLPGDVPMVAYRATVTDAMGGVSAELRVARAANANPTRTADWTVTRVFSATTACRANDCATGQVCLTGGRCAATTMGCMAACPAGKACVANMCQDVIAAGYVEDFSVGVLFPSLRVDAMGRGGVVFYHRDRGNLMGAQFNGTMWGTPFIIVGEAAMRDEGDFGAWSSLAIGSDGVWHVAYVDGYDETLNYVRVQGTARMGMPEIIDDGSRVGMTAFEDGKHLVGDSVMISLDAMNSPRVVYQDTSAGTLRYAQRGAMGWETRVLDSMTHTGYWSRIRNGRVGTFFRDLRPATPIANRFGVRVIAAP